MMMIPDLNQIDRMMSDLFLIVRMMSGLFLNLTVRMMSDLSLNLNLIVRKLKCSWMIHPLMNCMMKSHLFQ